MFSIKCLLNIASKIVNSLVTNKFKADKTVDILKILTANNHLIINALHHFTKTIW